jgi:hypothetical protein
MVLCSIWIATFLLFTALAIDVFLIGTALLQQRNAADYLALGIVKIYLDPPPGVSCDIPGCNSQTDPCISQKYTCAINKAILATNVTMVGKQGPQFYDGDLDIYYNSGDPSCVKRGLGQQGERECFNDGHGKEDDDGALVWHGFDPVNVNKGEVVFGHIDVPVTANSHFVPVDDVNSGTVNAVFVKLRLQNTAASPMILPFMSLLAPPEMLQFSSSVIAYRDGSTFNLTRILE